MKTFKQTHMIIMVIAGFVPLLVHAETSVGGIIGRDQTWELSKSPFLVTSDVLIKRFAHVTIEPGVRVFIAPGKGEPTDIPQYDALDSQAISIKIEGTLTCVGKRKEKIVFAPQSVAKDKLSWYGLILDKANGQFTEIAFTAISGAFYGITVSNSTPLIRNCLLEHNNIGINCRREGGARVYNCIIANNLSAGVRVQEANPTFYNSIIAYNRNNGLWCDGSSKITFEYNCVFGNTDGNLLDCDPMLGHLVKVNKKKDSVDRANNLYCDPILWGSPADSVAFARDTKIATDKSSVKNVLLAKLVNGTLSDSSYATYKKQNRPRYSLSRYSPCVNAGNPAGRFKDQNGSVNDIGIYGGPELFTDVKN